MIKKSLSDNHDLMQMRMKGQPVKCEFVSESSQCEDVAKLGTISEECDIRGFESYSNAELAVYEIQPVAIFESTFTRC